jgi:hypothetical protein
MCSACPTFPPALADLKAYATEQDAADDMYDDLDGEQCFDNYRFAFLDDAAQVALYEKAERDGCCGSSDEEVLVDGRRAWIGCNFGH